MSHLIVETPVALFWLGGDEVSFNEIKMQLKWWDEKTREKQLSK